MLDWPLLTGAAPLAVQITAVIGAVWLIARTLRSHRSLWAKVAELTLCLGFAAGLTALLDHLARTVWMLFPDRLDPAIYGWVGAGIFAVTLAVARCTSRVDERHGAASIAAGFVVLMACANQVNGIYGTYLTPRDLLGLPPHQDIALSDVASDVTVLPQVVPLEPGWSPPPGLGLRGKLTSAIIPGRRSGFGARPAAIYLPPAYFSDPRPQLPVLVLLAGQPGDPDNWVSAGRLAAIMNGFAALHHGLAPVVVMADDTGSRFADPLCVDSRRGHADTYLAEDVPRWVQAHFTVDPDPRGWAIAGVSYGGTCALQLGTNHPEVYPTFLDISGSLEPTLGSRPRTVADGFDGDQAAFTRVNPLDLLRTRRYPGSAARFVVGADDPTSRADAWTVDAAATAAGMNTGFAEVPGSHDWRCFTGALTMELPWLGQRMGLTR